MKVRDRYSGVIRDIAVEELLRAGSCLVYGQIERLEYELAQTRGALVNLITHLNIPDADILEIFEANYTYEAVEEPG